ncbi:MAG: pilus assembly protein TadG-related protein [Pseudolysinimonas sp.]
MNRRSWREDDGSTLPLICFYGALALLVTLIVAAATSLYLERKRLFTLADGAALVGAESFDLNHVTLTPQGPRPELTPTQVRAAVRAYLDGNPIGPFESLSLDEATTRDGRSAQVTVSAIWRPPVVTAFVPDGLRIDATAVSRTVFGRG